MKKVISVLLMLTLLAGFSALADGAMYDGDINFGDYKFGMTYGEIKAAEFVNNVQYNRYILPSRLVADTRSDMLGNLYWKELPFAQSMSVMLEQRDVAGHEWVNTQVYFNMPIVDGAMQNDESAAVLTGGKYVFMNDDAQSAFDDLKAKLTGAYGEPWLETASSDDIWGILEIGEGNEWMNDDPNMNESNNNPTYVVWKSSTNGGMVVLGIADVWGMRQTSVSYVDAAADEALLDFYASDSATPAGDNSSGL